MLNMALIRVANHYLQHKLKTILMESSLPKIIKLFRTALDFEDVSILTG